MHFPLVYDDEIEIVRQFLLLVALLGVLSHVVVVYLALILAM